MIRITSARISFHGLGGSPARASTISQRALRQLAVPRLDVGGEAARRPRVQLTVRVPHGASDEAIAAQVGEALRRRLGRGSTG